MLLASDPAAAIRQGMIDRGIPAHVADGFLMNFRDESGLRTDINEIAPIVPGSRGGYGLAQWTGPRRRALEDFAASRGVPASDMNLQLDFLMSELQGPESRAAQAIFAAPDSATAADAILRQFLRPAAEHQARRSAAYLGGQQQGQPMQQPQGLLGTVSTSTADPQNPSIWDALVGRLPDRVQPLARRTIGDADWRDRMAIALAGMSMRPNEALIGTLQGRMDERATERRVNQTVQWLQSIGRTDLAEAVAAGSLMGDQAAAIAMQPQAQPIEINGQLVDPTTGAVIGDYRTPEQPDPGYRTLTPEEAAAAGLPTDGVWQVSPSGQYQRVAGTEGAAPADPTDLRKEWNALPQVRAFADRAASYNNIVASAQNPSAAGDISLIYNYMKMLDPGSTVMQGEIATAANAGGIDARTMAAYNALISGETFTEEMRKDYLSRATMLYQNQEQGYQNIRRQYEETARALGLDPEATLTDYRTQPKGQVLPGSSNTPRATPNAGQNVTPPPEAVRQNETVRGFAERRGMTVEEYWFSLDDATRQALIDGLGR